MTLTFGRAVLPDPSSVSSSGAFVTFSGMAYSSAATAANRAAEVQMLEAQVLGMVGNPDEDAFPVVWSAESKWDGFYTEIDASWDWVNDGSGRVSVANWSITGRRLTSGTGDYANVEMSNSQVLRTNGHGTTSATTILYAIPTTIKDYDARGASFTGSVSRSFNGGTVTCLYNSLSSPTTGTIGLAQSSSAFYDGTCSVEFQAADDAWYPLIGRKVPDGSAGRWRITNGCFRVQPSSTVGSLEACVYNGSAWESVEFQGNFYNGSAHSAVNLAASTTEWLPPFILRNSPDAVVLSLIGVGATAGRIGMTMSLRRGAYHVEMVMRSPQGRPGLRATAATASTALATATAGVRATSNDANGNRFVLMSAASCTNDTTNGRIYVNDATANVAYTFAMGVEYDGSSAASGNTSSNLLAQFLGMANVVTRVVAR